MSVGQADRFREGRRRQRHRPHPVGLRARVTDQEFLTFPLFTLVRGETVWKIGIGADVGCSEWPKQDEDVPLRPLEPLETGDQVPSSYFPNSFGKGVLGSPHSPDPTPKPCPHRIYVILVT